MSDSSKKTKVIKVGILGDKYVGKTYLCHKLTGRNYEGYEQTASIVEFKSKKSPEASKFVYVDNPPLDNLSIINIGSVYQFNVLVFLFKDCDSFTKLFEFFETIKQTLESQQNHHVRQYWSQPQKIIVVYSNYQSTKDIEVQQLFAILMEQIKQFCNQVIFQPFILRAQPQNWKDLKILIQKQPINQQNNQEVSDMSKQAKSARLKKQLSKKQGQFNGPVQQVQELEAKLNQQKFDLRTQQKTKGAVFNKELEPIKNIMVGDNSASQSKQVKSRSAETIKSKSKQITNKVPHSSISETKLQLPYQTEPKTIKSSLISKYNGLESKNIDFRKSSIRQKIRQSFQVDQSRKSVVGNSDVPEYIQVKKAEEAIVINKNKNLLQSFRDTINQTDPKVDQQILQYNEEKKKKLLNCVQNSEDQTDKNFLQYKSNQPLKKYEVNPQNKVQITIAKRTKQKPNSEFQKNNNFKRQIKGQSDLTKCGCQIY